MSCRVGDRRDREDVGGIEVRSIDGDRAPAQEVDCGVAAGRRIEEFVQALGELADIHGNHTASRRGRWRDAHGEIVQIDCAQIANGDSRSPAATDDEVLDIVRKDLHHDVVE